MLSMVMTMGSFGCVRRCAVVGVYGWSGVGGSGPTPLGLAGCPTSVGGGDVTSHVLPAILGQGAQEPRVLVHEVSFQDRG
jgi:hypothetical protein